jgi:hypothetical protein
MPSCLVSADLRGMVTAKSGAGEASADAPLAHPMSEIEPPLENRSTGRIWDAGAIFGIEVLLLAIVFFPLTVSENVGLYVQTGELLLEGQRPYVDFVDLNPPLIMYLNIVPVFLSAVFGGHPLLVFQLCVVGLAGVSACAMRGVMRRRFSAEGAGLILVAWVLFSIHVYLRVEFGEREHLFALVLGPYFILRALRWGDSEGDGVGVWAAAAIGIAAGIGASLKPHFVMVALAPEIWWIVSRRSARPLIKPETVGFFAAVAAYAIHFAFLPGDVRDGFFARVFPLATEDYAAFNMPTQRMLRDPVLLICAAIAVAPFFVRPVRAPAIGGAARPLGVLTLAALAMYFAQAKGWGYQKIPILMGAYLIVPAMAGVAGAFGEEAGRVFKVRTSARAVALAAMALGVAGAGAFAVRTQARGYPPKVTRPLAEIIERYTDPGDSVLVVSTIVPPAYPLLTQMERRPASRFLWFFQVPMIYGEADYAPRDGMQEQENYLLESLAADLQARRPPLILVSRNCPSCPEGFQLLEWLKRKPDVAEVLAGYEHAGVTERMDVFVREGSNAEARAQ